MHQILENIKIVCIIYGLDVDGTGNVLLIFVFEHNLNSVTCECLVFSGFPPVVTLDQ